MSPENDSQTLRRNLKRIGIVAGMIAVVVLAVGVYVRLSEASDLKTWTRSAEIPTVALVTPVASGKGQALILPGTLQAYYDAKLYARVPGYVKAWYKDIGAQVKAGELLAVIDTPELDQQISQARADLGNAAAAQKLSSSTAQRWESLLPLDAVSKQDVEDKDEDLASKSGAVKSAQANLDRLQALKGFSRIVAPFAGVVTKRTIDIGALVNAGTGASDEPLFAVADTHALRLYVNVPQSYSAQIVPGMTVSLTVPEYPGRTFPAKLVSTSGAIAALSSSLLVEFSVDNSAGLLKPGGFAQVSMGLPAGATQLQLPASALLYRAEGLRVATLGPDDRIVLKPITIGTDMGTQVIIASGLSPHDKVVNNPPDSLASGDKVRVGTNADAD
jgi:membrane fusion protein, multidrug efflux system